MTPFASLVWPFFEEEDGQWVRKCSFERKAKVKRMSIVERTPEPFLQIRQSVMGAECPVGHVSFDAAVRQVEFHVFRMEGDGRVNLSREEWEAIDKWVREQFDA